MIILSLVLNKIINNRINETDNGANRLDNELIYNQQQQQHNMNNDHDAQALLEQTELINQFHHNNIPLSNSPVSTPKTKNNVNNNNRNYVQSKRKNSIQINQTKNGNNTSENNQLPPSSIVPTLTNVDEIFHLLSQKIAKYCQILADLTNCEVFYKAQLPIVNQPGTNDISSSKSSKKIRHQNNENKHSSNSNQSSMKRNQNGSRKRSLYWGTHQMLFQYSHNQGDASFYN